MRLRHYKDKSIPSQWVQMDESYRLLSGTNSSYVLTKIEYVLPRIINKAR